MIRWEVRAGRKNDAHFSVLGEWWYSALRWEIKEEKSQEYELSFGWFKGTSGAFGQRCNWQTTWIRSSEEVWSVQTTGMVSEKTTHFVSLAYILAYFNRLATCYWQLPTVAYRLCKDRGHKNRVLLCSDWHMVDLQ